MVMVTNFPPPETGIKHEQKNTRVIMNDSDMGTGTLFIAESRVSWVENSTGRGFSLEYPHICLHAVSRDLANFPEECLYLMLDHYISMGEEVNRRNEEDEDDEEDDEDKSTEVRFIPQDKAALNCMYVAMTECQALHPDPNDSLSEDSEVADNEDEGEYDDFHPNGDTDYSHMNGGVEMEVEEGQFEDAET